MRADTIAPGDQLWQDGDQAEPDGWTNRSHLVYTVLSVLPPAYAAAELPQAGTGSVCVLVRYEVDGGTDVRTFTADQDVPLYRPEGQA